MGRKSDNYCINNPIGLVVILSSKKKKKKKTKQNKTKKLGIITNSFKKHN